MALVDSLLSAIVRADGDALVMHVGERPYVVVGSQTINISTHGMNLDAMTGMLAQLLPADSAAQLEEFGAVEYRVPHAGEDRFTVVAARGGDDIWIEIRRRRPQAAVAVEAPKAPPVAAAPPPPPTPVAAPEPPPVVAAPVLAPAPVDEPIVAQAPPPEPVVALAHAVDPLVAEAPVLEVVAEEEPAAEPVPEAPPIQVAEPVYDMEPPTEAEFRTAHLEVIEPEPAIDVEAAPLLPTTVAETLAQPLWGAAAEPSPVAEAPVPIAEPIPDPVVATPAPSVEPIPAPVAAIPEPIVEPFPEAVASVPGPVAEPIPEPVALRTESPAPAPVAEPEPVVAPDPVSAPLPIVQPAAAMPEPAPITIAASAEAALPEPQRELTSGVVVPMTRTVRIEVPPRVASRTSADIERLLRVAVARGASALFLTSESRPWLRVEGDLRQLESESALSRADVERAIMDMAPESGHESIGKGEATEWLSEFAEVGRIRCTTFNDHRGPGVLLRMIATRAATAEQLGLEREVQALATEPQGIVLIAGARTSGKSMLLSALVDLVNRQRAEFVITLERQIRLVHDNKNALVSQREIRGGAEESVSAARSALRESPDVLVVDDLVSSHMVPLLLTAASEGLLVFVSITAPSTSDAAQRFIELAPPEMRKAVQAAMAESFRGAVAQTLLKKAGGGLVAAREVLLATAPVTRVIADGQLGQLPLALESGRKHGMVSFTEALAEYVRAGTVDVREAFRKAPDRDRLLQQLKRDGVDTSVVERLA